LRFVAKKVPMETLKQIKIGNTLISVARGDLTACDVDAIVNAANSQLQHGGGVAGVIVRKGGSIIQRESDKIGYVPVGKSVLTTGGNLKARNVIHAVGPRWGEGDEERKLASALVSTLTLAAEKGFSTIALPAISAGIFGFPKHRCAEILFGETVRFLKSNETTLNQITFCLMDEEVIGHFLTAMKAKEPAA
jgi:O-acetyl-ADP-ribose deacetylase